MLRNWGFKNILYIIALALILTAPAQICAQEAAEKAPAKARCASGYAFDPSRGECMACNRPCLTGFKGICNRGIMDCSGEKPSCRPTIEPGERIEICNGEDDDCDGTIDEGFDKDRDRYTTCSGDCNDRDASIHPDAVERCNGQDDNCNGLMDDGFNVGRACTVGLGECMREGRFVCSESGFESICDAEAGRPGREICDGRDNDCDGAVDEALGEHSCGVGACRRTVPVCEGGKLTECRPGEPAAELCGDEIDNDCDGRVDEGYADLGRTCHEGVGACRNAGKYVCSDDRLSLVCSASGGEPRAEICGNRVDDDCDGIVDTDTPGLGEPCDNRQLGECRREGKLVCDRSEAVLVCSAREVKPKQEACDGRDNDCDGVIDNGVLNACGTCGKLPGVIGDACMVPGGDECATGVWTCKADAPGTAFCALGANVSEGRECAADDNQCTRDICQGGVCAHLPLADGVACDDGDACTTGDACRTSSCEPGKRLLCDDENPCTEDSCDSKTGCVNRKIGTGELNSCGGCEKLAALPGSPCVLEEKFGTCRVGQYACGPAGSIECAQITFGRRESCNGIDDDCDGKVDNDLGTTTCGLGACEVEVAMCEKGAPVECVPADPLPETCANMGVDNDCNGVPDDVAGLGLRCPVAIGTCIVPGERRCVGDAEKPVCVPVNARYAEDDDGNGIANYCDQEAGIASMEGEEVGVRLAEGGANHAGRSSLFDLSRTRASMLPWQRVMGSAVIGERSPDRAMLLVSGGVGKQSGLAVLRAKDAVSVAGPSFRTCEAAVGESPMLLASIGAHGGVVATTDDGYIRYHKIASQIPSPSAENLKCRLYGERLPLAAERRVRIGGREVVCKVERIEDMAILSGKPLRIVGAAACGIKGKSILARSRSAVLIDVVSELPGGGYQTQTIPFFHATGDVERAVVTPLGKGGGAFFAAAAIKGLSVLGVCRLGSSEWKCDTRQARAVTSPVAFAHLIGARDGRVHMLAVSEDGKAFDITVGSGGKWDVKKAGSAGGRGLVGSAMLMPPQKGASRVLLLARERGISAARISWSRDGYLRITRFSKERVDPEAPADSVFPGGNLSFGRPEALAVLPLKRFGGEDTFAAFQIKKGMKTVGAMGFFYMNANESPRGTLTDVEVRGGRGRARLAFTDPTGDRLTYRAWIRANHGGSLDHWIDGLERGVLRFSVKGDAAVGMWPIEIVVEAADSGGQTARVRTVVARDGRVESITESTEKR